ncbi:MAG: ABC transporter ATP-binding protein [Ilumatobacter sp.]|uniref:ABC transporter ATP-binding protein n=1 Tax=Ilumatobacter sp. TaxID=1967498 RepID=UPI002634964C|nr:ABC transporter ATP-binding protein [Ilumatobacter sp.]MDJ0767469.1 ABC transporter ATP-binding protein [Ilumatobacter sp.]
MATVLERLVRTRAEQSAPRGAEVTIDGVTIRFGDTVAVDDASLAIEAGATVSLLGPSGCGKTSLLRAIAGLERPVGGAVAIGSRTVSSAADRTWVKPERRNVGMVFQDGALFPHLTVAQNIAFGLDRDGAASHRVAELLELVDLVGLSGRLPETLSGGQQQRVALARSLAPEPSVLLLDEPFSALDAGLRVQVRSEVAGILREVGVTSIFVTHDQDEAFVLGDRVAVMGDGRILQVGTPDELYRRPTTPWVASFVGEANLLDGTPSGTISGGSTAETAIGVVPLAGGRVADSRTRLSVLVRPEQVRLTDGDDAVVTTVEYYGHDVRYELRLDDGSTLAARTHPDQLLHAGDSVGVAFAGDPTEAWPT